MTPREIAEKILGLKPKQELDQYNIIDFNIERIEQALIQYGQEERRRWLNECADINRYSCKCDSTSCKCLGNANKKILSLLKK